MGFKEGRDLLRDPIGRSPGVTHSVSLRHASEHAPLTQAVTSIEVEVLTQAKLVEYATDADGGDAVRATYLGECSDQAGVPSCLHSLADLRLPLLLCQPSPSPDPLRVT